MKSINALKLLLLATCYMNSSSSTMALDFSLFADITLQESNYSDDNTNFTLGAVDFFAAQQINENTSALIELVFENDGDGFIVDLERIWIRHHFSDQLKVSAGRFHTPLGYWNRNLHHGAILQDTVGRPFFLDFEDGDSGILPLHSIGLMANGNLFPNSDEVNYEVILSNGPSLDSSGGFRPDEAPELDPNNTSDINSAKSIAARLTYHPEDSEWTIGLFTMINDIGESSIKGLVDKGNSLVKQNIYGMDFRFNYENHDILAEFFSLNHDDKILDNGSHNSLAFYIQSGYQISEKIKLVYRYSNLSFDVDDTYYMLLGINEQSHHVVTVNYEIDGFNLLKFEIDSTVNRDPLIDDGSTFRIQWSFLIP